MKRAPSSVINAFEQGWLNILLSSPMDGFGTADAFAYTCHGSTIKVAASTSGYRMQAYGCDTQEESPLLERKMLVGRAGIRWWRIGGEE